MVKKRKMDYLKKSCLTFFLLSFPLIGHTAEQEFSSENSFYAKRPATIECVVEAAAKQQVPANILLAIASQEFGKNGEFVLNRNGSQDIGHFQINTVHWKPKKGIFSKYPSITQEDVAWRGCYNAELAAWLLKQAIEEKNGKDYWTRVAGYHSHDPYFNAVYRSRIIPLAKKWGDWLQQRYSNVSISYQK